MEIKKGVDLRLRKIWSIKEEYSNKSKEYKDYLIGRGHKLKNFKGSFNDVLNMSRQQSRIKKTKNTNSKNNNHFQNILRLFDVLPIFPSTASETMGDYYL